MDNLWSLCANQDHNSSIVIEDQKYWVIIIAQNGGQLHELPNYLNGL